MIYLDSSDMTVKYSGNLLFSNNLGSFQVFNSNITFMGCIMFVNNHPLTREEGAITLSQSTAYINGDCSIQNNHAENGGRLLSIESKIYMSGDVTIAHNTATSNGGGVYLSNSELNCQRNSILLLDNNAEGKGGGLHAVSSILNMISDYLYVESIYWDKVVLHKKCSRNWRWIVLGSQCKIPYTYIQ